MATLDTSIYQDAHGVCVRPRMGSGKNALKIKPKRYPLGTPLHIMQAWRDDALKKARRQRPDVQRGTLRADVELYLRTADITKKTRKAREQQLAWWCAQPAAFEAKVYSPEAVGLEAAAIKAGRKEPRTHTLGDLHRSELDLARLAEILQVAFKASDDTVDPTEFANTSNHYRTALMHLFAVLDRFDKDAINPIEKIDARPRKLAEPSGQDARVVVEILKHVGDKPKQGGGHPGDLTKIRLAVLAWVHITPTQLMGIDPTRDFHDVPDATHEDIIDGAITLTKRPRLKGRKNKPIPPPETIPLNPWGVSAMRAFAACEAVWNHPKRKGNFSMSPVNRIVKRAAARAEQALRARGITHVDHVPLDLSGFTLYHLKHSLATTAQIASGGLVNREGHIRVSPGLQRSLDHSSQRTTMVYAHAAIDPIIRAVNRTTSLFLGALFQQPLRPRAEPLRLVERATGEGVSL